MLIVEESYDYGIESVSCYWNTKILILLYLVLCCILCDLQSIGTSDQLREDWCKDSSFHSLSSKTTPLISYTVNFLMKLFTMVCCGMSIKRSCFPPIGPSKETSILFVTSMCLYICSTELIYLLHIMRVIYLLIWYGMDNSIPNQQSQNFTISNFIFKMIR